MAKIIEEAITFDDILIVPGLSSITPTDVNTETKLTRNISLKIPLMSAAMDTVTEVRLAIALAQEGGIGIIHKNMAPEEQCKMVEFVKRSANGVILDPVTLFPTATVKEAKSIMQTRQISGLPVIDDKKKVLGIVTNRDLRFQYRDNVKVKDIMTAENLVTAPPGTSLKKARDILYKNKVEKLLLVDKSQRLKGLITIKDIHQSEQFPNACKDKLGRFRVGAAIGALDIDRAAALAQTPVDVLVVDTAHGHSTKVIEMVKRLKKKYKIDVIAGNVATTEGAKALIQAGVDAVKVGIGPGSICTTRIVTGVGVPQVTAIFNVAKACQSAKVPLIADGGIRYSGDISKALVAGAHMVMIGSIFAGTTESPGEEILVGGRTYKTCRGMGSLSAMQMGSKDRYSQGDVQENTKLVPEGIEGMVPYKGHLSQVVHQLVGGLKATMHYVGSKTIPELQRKGKFVKVSSSTVRESHPHDVTITKEAPNYSLIDS